MFINVYLYIYIYSYIYIFIGASDSALSLLDQLLLFDPEDRATVDDALTHNFLKDNLMNKVSRKAYFLYICMYIYTNVYTHVYIHIYI
jgi:serine/threonine protein kinase